MAAPGIEPGPYRLVAVCTSSMCDAAANQWRILTTALLCTDFTPRSSAVEVYNGASDANASSTAVLISLSASPLR